MQIIERLTSLVRTPKQAENEAKTAENTPDSSSEQLKTDLGIAREQHATVESKLKVATEQLREVQGRFDAQVEAYSVGISETIPDRGELAGLISITDSLRRVESEQRANVAALANQITQRELAEALARDVELLPSLIACSESQLEVFEAAVRQVKAAETELFASLYNPHTGLKRRMASEELKRQQARARHLAAKRARDIAAEHGYAIDKRFQVDGETFLGDEFEQNLALRNAALARQ